MSASDFTPNAPDIRLLVSAGTFSLAGMIIRWSENIILLLTIISFYFFALYT